jgi:hypothetical protein
MDLCLAFWALDRTSTPKHPKIFPTGPHFFTGQEAHANAREVAPQLRSSWGGFHIT